MILTTTAEANKLIADVWAARADFAKDHPEVIKGLVAGIFEGMDRLQDPTQREKAYAWMAEGYGMQADEVQRDAQRRALDQLRGEQGLLPERQRPGQLRAHLEERDLRVPRAGPHRHAGPLRRGDGLRALQELDKAGSFAHQKDESRASFAPTSYKKISAESPILTQTIRINFYPNSANVYEPQHDENGKPVSNTLYDPSVAATLEKVARLVGPVRARRGGGRRPHRLVDEGQGARASRT